MTAVWPLFEPHIDRALRFGGGVDTSDDMRVECAEGRGYLLGVFHGKQVAAGLVMRVRVCRRIKILEILLLGGSGREEWLTDLLWRIDEVAKTSDCAKIEFRGRPGWTKLLAKHGYFPRSYFFDKVMP